jgi:uncharacterized protein YjbI with pentapeptide repeats
LSPANLCGPTLSGTDLTEARREEADFTGVTADERTVWPAGFDKQPLSLCVEAD